LQPFHSNPVYIMFTRTQKRMSTLKMSSITTLGIYKIVGGQPSETRRWYFILSRRIKSGPRTFL
jgi:hypothetical protein